MACSRVLGMELLFRTPFLECGSSHIFIWRRIGRMGGLDLAPKSVVLKGCRSELRIPFLLIFYRLSLLLPSKVHLKLLKCLLLTLL